MTYIYQAGQVDSLMCKAQLVLSRGVRILCMSYDAFPGLEMYCTYPAQHLTTVAYQYVDISKGLFGRVGMRVAAQSKPLPRKAQVPRGGAVLADTKSLVCNL